MKYVLSQSLYISASIFLLSIYSIPAKTQILPDKSFGKNSSIVKRNSSNTGVITGGLTKENSLFHSFSSFSINKNKSIYFTPKSDIKNIFTRVTGIKSDIDGTLGVRGNSNLYFINSNGINFGNNAKIDVTGSILLSTASNITFGKNIFFNTNNISYNLKNYDSNLPIILEMDKARNIDIFNNPNTFVEEFFLSNLSDNRNSSGEILGLNSGQEGNFSVVAGNINFNGGIINSYSGNVNLLAIKDGFVNIIPRSGQISPRNISYFGDINLEQLSQINLKSINGGSIRLYADTINIESGSLIKHSTLDLLNQIESSKIYVNSDRLNISSIIDINKFSSNKPIRSGILSRAINGKGADIDISSKFVNLIDGGFVTSLSFGNSKSGNIYLNSEDILIDNAFKDSISISSIRNIGTDNSSVSNININARSLKLLDSGTISTYAIKNAEAGDINITLQEDLEVSGLNSFFPKFSSIIQTLSLSEKKAGNISIVAKDITVLDGGGIGSFSALSGDTGRVNIESDSIYISGVRENPSDIFSEVDFTDPSVISLVSQLSGIDDFPFQGDANSIIINANKISLDNGAEISVTNNGNGDAGFIDLSSQNISLSNKAQIIAATNGGDGGNIDINSDLIYLDKSNILTTAEGNGSGGNIRSFSSFFTLNDSNIQANAQNSSAGNIEISSDLIIKNEGSDITASSNLGTNSDGEVSIVQRENELRLIYDFPEIVFSPTTLKYKCSENSTNSSIINHGLGSDTILLSERQKKALNLQQRIEFASQFYYIDSETGKKKPFKPLLAIEENDDGKVELIFSAEKSKGLQNLLSSLDNNCSIKS